MRLFNVRSLFVFDGLVFTLVGAVVLFLPSASAASLPPEAGAAPHLMDTRRLLAAAYISVGLFLLAFGRAQVPAGLLRLACRLRAVSLLTLVTTNLVQILSGRWKPPSLWVYVVAFSLMALGYLLGAPRTEPAAALEPGRST
ncbi:MAG TPA: hypothetical protein VK458_20665 [Myxococcaceae bacterium]|nr:hypothetical protein [Myxococcaceae bacterium]